MVPVELMKTLDVFEGMTEAELRSIAECSDIVEYPKGMTVFKENEDAKQLFVLLEGAVSINFEVGRNREVMVHTVGYGQAFGWSALVQPYQFTATARCVNPSKVVAIDRERLRRLIELDCHMGFIIMEKLAELVSGRLRDTRMQLVSMIHG